MKLKRLSKIIITGTLSSLMCASLYMTQNEGTSFESFAIKYDIRDSEHGTGALPMTPEEWEEYVNNINHSTTEKSFKMLDGDLTQLPEICDLSKSIYFPPIGNQAGTNSCVSWAATYYQFTYEANKLNNITTTEENAYSPRWTYNFVNKGKNNGTSFEATYSVLKEHGALTMSDYPCNIENFFSWSDNTEAMIKALNTRMSGNEHRVVINGLNASASENLNEIKSLLANGKVLTFLTTLNYEYGDRSIIIDNKISDYINPKNNCKERIVYRANELSGMGHAMTIVGYDDNVWCDINNNGVKDISELGAFKIANSYGKGDDNGTDGYVNDGFIWIAYDALNSNTKVPEMSTNESNRVAVFGYGNDNVVYYIDVENKSPNYVGQLNINTDYPHTLNVNSRRNINKNTNETQTEQKFISFLGENEQSTYLPYNGTLVFDYDDLCEPISDYINGYNWFVNVEGNHNSLSFKITDNLSNTIVDFGKIGTGDSYKPINLSMGDLDYNGVVDVNDSKILFNSIYNNEKLSNLQEYLASNMNKDFSVHAAITPSGYDDIGKVLDNLNVGNIAWDSVPSDVSLQTLIDGNYDVLFINCAEDVETNGEVIKSFVEQGGTVYASDWALDALIEAFPERNITYTTANPQNITANITDRGLITSTGLDTIPINFNLPDWRLINSMLQDDVTTYINGSVAASNDTFPLVFSFPYGNNGGKVFYTSFHHEANMTDEMQDVLNDLILTINHNKDINDLNEWMQINQYYSIMHNVGIADANMSSKSYVLDKLENSKEFAVITDEAGNFSIELTSPDGNVYTNYKNGEFLSGLVSDPSDNVQVYSLGKRGLRISNPDNLSNENNHWSYRVISHLPYTSSFVTGVAEKNEKAVLDYIIDYKVTQDWGVGQNIEITITNIGDRPIRNWALQCDNFFGTVTNVWNGKLQGDNIIRNDIHNSDIASGSSITMGYTLTNATGEVPEFTLCSFRNAKNDGYSVDFDVLSEWGEGFIGNITITNTTDTPIMAWELNFTAENFIIASTSQFEILKNVGNNYTITGTYNGNIPIPAYSSITLQFNGEKTGNPSISDILMTEMIIQE